jgi:hypothetical protein
LRAINGNIHQGEINSGGFLWSARFCARSAVADFVVG